MAKTVYLSYTRKAAEVRIDVVQFTTQPDIVFIIEDYTPTGRADIYIEKPSGEEIYNSCAIDGNKVTFTPTTQCFAEVGENKAQLQFLDGQKLAVSFPMVFVVAENIIDSDAAESQSEFTELQEAISTIGQYDQRIDDVEQEINDALITVRDSLAATIAELDEKIDGVIVQDPDKPLSGALDQQINSGLIVAANYEETITLQGGRDLTLTAVERTMLTSGDAISISSQYGGIGITGQNVSITTDVGGSVDIKTTEAHIGDNIDIYEGEIKASKVYANNIGATKSISPTTQSLTSDTWANLGSVTLEGDSGGVYGNNAVWLVIASGSFANNSSGNRMIVVSNEAASGNAINNAFRDYKAPATGATTTAQCIGIILVPIEETRTIYVNAKQNSGSNINASCRIHAVRIV